MVVARNCRWLGKENQMNVESPFTMIHSEADLPWVTGATPPPPPLSMVSRSRLENSSTTLKKLLDHTFCAFRITISGTPILLARVDFLKRLLDWELTRKYSWKLRKYCATATVQSRIRDKKPI
jgi:hypothetical protein